MGADVDSKCLGTDCDPLGPADDPKNVVELQVIGTNHGCLDTPLMLDHTVQAIMTGEGPSEHWVSHMNDPFAFNGVGAMYAAAYLGPFSESGAPTYPKGEYPQ